MIPPPLEGKRPPSDRVLVACAFLAALTVRALIAWATPVINSDGPIYLAQAEAIMAGDFAKAVVDHSYAPGTAMLVALVTLCGIPLGAAGYVVSVLAGALAVFPLHVLSRAAFPRRTAIAAVFLYAFLPNPSRLSGSVLTTGLFLFVSCLGLALAAQVHTRPHVRTALLTGIIAAFAYMVRADGLVLLPFAAAAAALARDRRTATRIALAVLVLAPTVAAAWAYSRYAHTGEGVSFTNKFRIGHGERFLSLLSFPPAQVFSLFWEDLTEDIFALFLPFLVAGLLVRAQGGDARIRRALLVAVVVWAAGLLKYTDATGVMSKRYAAPLAVLLLPWTAHGLLAAAGAITRVARAGERATGWAPAVAVGLLCLACLPKLLRIPEGHRVVERMAGLWLRDVSPAGRPILCGGTRVGYYAGRRVAPRGLTHLPIDRALWELRRRGVEYIVNDPGLEDYAPAFVRAVRLSGLPLAGRFTLEGASPVEVYRLATSTTGCRPSARVRK